MSTPYDVCTDGRSLYVADCVNARILIFNAIPTSNNAYADFQLHITVYNGVWSDGTRLITGRYYSQRLDIYNSIPTQEAQPPDVQFLPPTNAGANSATPYHMYFDGTHLYVLDFNGSRVLIWNYLPTTGHTDCDVVVGQTNFASLSSNQGGGPGANTLSLSTGSPSGVWSDGSKLIITDRGNNRVLIWNSIPTTNNASADVVIGQTNFTSNSANQGRSACGADTISGPRTVCSDGKRLFIADMNNFRILVYNNIPTANGASADYVIGQPDFTSGSIRDLSRDSCSYVRGLSTDGKRLFAAANGNCVLVYNITYKSENFTGTPSSTTQINYSWTNSCALNDGFRILDGSDLTKVEVSGNARATTESGLLPNTLYSRKIQTYNVGDAVTSETITICSLAATPEISTATASYDSVNGYNCVIAVNANGNPAGTNYAVSTDNGSNWLQADGTISATVYWSTSTTGWTYKNLSPDTTYSFKVKAKNANGVETILSAAASAGHLPTAKAFSGITTTEITANWGANGNPATTEYYCENTTKGTNSGWITSTSWTSTGLITSTQYSFRVKARSADWPETGWISLGTQYTAGKLAPDLLKTASLGLIEGDIISKLAKITIMINSGLTVDTGTIRFYIDGIAVTDGTLLYYDSIAQESGVATIEYTIKNPLAVGTHTIKVSIVTEDGTLYEKEVSSLKVMSDSATVGASLAYPNPYDPLKGEIKFGYNLALDADVTIYVFDINGRFIFKQSCLSGQRGGTAGYNETTWNGINAFGSMLDNDVYLVRIAETNTGNVIGKLKILVLKGGISSSKKERKTAGVLGPGGKGDNKHGDNGGSSGITVILLSVLTGLVTLDAMMRFYRVIKKIKKR
ncbi:MAG: hypothetical protein NTZ10_01860 [Candidatus Saganbacteria bacterium]|nr:hypothetical protein [Candidatus Saganbacteria bacterium]